MKYQNLSAFEKHLQQAAKVQLSLVFLIVSACPYERKKIAEKIMAAIHTQQPDVSMQIKEAVQGSLEKQINELNTTSLLSGKRALYLDSIDKLKKSGLVALAEYVASPSPFAYLLLGASASKQLDDLYAKGKKELIVCDLSQEKPWDRRDRLKRLLIDEAARAGKRLNGDAAEHLLENVGLNRPALEQEVVKLITYAGERKELTLQDVLALCSVQKQLSPWQLAEAIVWKESWSRTGDTIDLSMLLPLVSQLRLQLQHGLILSVLVERRAAQEEIAHYLPTVKPALLDKMLVIVKRRRSMFFKRALALLFDMELMAKSSAFEPDLILDLFLAKLALYSTLTTGGTAFASIWPGV